MRICNIPRKSTLPRRSALQGTLGPASGAPPHRMACRYALTAVARRQFFCSTTAARARRTASILCRAQWPRHAACSSGINLNLQRGSPVHTEALENENLSLEKILKVQVVSTYIYIAEKRKVQNCHEMFGRQRRLRDCCMLCRPRPAPGGEQTGAPASGHRLSAPEPHCRWLGPPDSGAATAARQQHDSPPG